MNVLSYEGPVGADPITVSLCKQFKELSGTEQRWWFMQENSFHCCQRKQVPSHCICDFPESVVQGHSSYCNEFLSPIFHKNETSIQFEQTNRQMFFQFNTFFAQSMLGFDELSVVQPIFISGYHLALSPQILFNCSGFRSTFYWNLPWPKEVDRFYMPFVAEIALALLHAQNLAFSTPECATNFLSFVECGMPNFRVNVLGRKIESVHEPELSTSIQWHPFAYKSNN